MKPNSPEAAVQNGTRPAWPAPRPASNDWELAKKSLCLLKASRAGSGGKLARMLRGSNSFSSASSLIRWRGSWKKKHIWLVFDDGAKKCRASFDQHDVKKEKMILQGVSYGVTCIWKMSLSTPQSIYWSCPILAANGRLSSKTLSLSLKTTKLKGQLLRSTSIQQHKFHA